MQFTKTLLFVTNYGVVAILDKAWDLGVKAWDTAIDFITVDPEETVQATQAVGNFSDSLFNANWAELINGQSHIYEAIVKVSLVLATTLIGFWAIPWLNTLLNEGYSKKTVDELIYPLLVVLLLALNNGYVLSNVNLLFRGTTNYIRNQILTETANGISYEQLIRDENWSQSHRLMFSNEVRKCRLLSDEQKSEEELKAAKNDCIDKAKKKIQEQAEAEGVKVEGLFVTQALTAVVNPVIDMVIFTVLTTFEAGFSFMVEISFLLTAYISPFFLVFTLIPGQSKLIYAWLSAWFGLGLMKISYTIVVGMAASAVSNTGDENVLLLPLMQAVFSPILATAIASGGGIAFFNLLSSIAGSVVRLGVKVLMAGLAG